MILLLSRSLSCISFALACTAIAACGGSPTPPEFALTFQSTHMAVVTDIVQVSAYEVKSGDGEFASRSICGTILARLRKAQDVGLEPLVRSAVASPCELQDAKKGSLEVTYGTRALVGIGYDANGNEIVIGCTVAVVELGAAPITVAMTLFDPSKPLPGETTCTKLADRCSGAC